jgi:cell division septum initiation protein DivIVA
MSQTEKEQVQAPVPDRSLLAASLYAAMQNNKELRDEILRLERNLTEAEDLMSRLNAKISILQTLQKHGTTKNPTAIANTPVSNNRS